MTHPAPPWLADFMAAEHLPPGFAALVETVWAPLADDIVRAAAGHGPGFVAGVCGTQASGKSTACAVVQRLLEAKGLSVALLSLDDLYLTHAERHALGKTLHPLFATRGPPGTHDVVLGERVLDALGRPGSLALPRFIKGQDDRAPAADWPVVDAPVDIILFEGWCVGARPQDPATLVSPVNDLERLEDPDGVWRRAINDALAGPYQALFGRIGWLALLAAPGFEAVLAWRREQEAKLAARLARDGGPGRAMTPGEVARFIAHYERLTRHILAEMPARADQVIRLDVSRNAVLQG